MQTQFDNFINEFYTGKYASAGFKSGEPTNEYEFNVDIKYDTDNEDIIKKDILSKYNITYKNMSLERFGDTQSLNLKFFSYSNYEAASIVTTILDELVEKEIPFDSRTIDVPTLRKEDRTKVSGFK